MTALVLALVAAANGTASLVDVHEAIPRAVLEMHYATPKNFLHQAVYSKARCLLRPDAAASLGKSEARLEAQGFRLKLWDCYRPLSVQRAMWKLVPVKGLVADPDHGGSHHNRATAIDASLVDLEGHDIPMPTEHDDFTKAGRRDAPCADARACSNRAVLRAALEAEGFTTIRTEWWHFDAAGADHAPLLDEPL